MAKLYRIKDWDRHYEVSDSKKVAGPLQWVPVRTKTDGFGYLRITQEKNRAELLAAWYLMLGIAAKQTREERGKLARDGIPLTPDDMELLTRFPAQLFERALVFFSDPKQGWMYSDETGCHPDASGQNPLPSESSGPTVQDSTGHTGQDKTVEQNAAVAAPASVSDADWLQSLGQLPAYAGIDVAREHGKMVAWCSANRKQPTRRRFVNWLNRAERPIQIGQARPPQRPAIREPQGWKGFLNRTYPESVYSAGGKTEAHEWAQLPPDVQTKLAGEIRRNEEAA
jgi:hypothetical protein